jgi:hypothetical protein
MVRVWIGIVGMNLMAGQVLALDVPLTVKETAGVDRVQNPVNSGVPLPKGAVKDAAALRLLDAQGNVVLASIEPRARWLGDESLKWVTVHFLANVPANGTATYRLATSDAALPRSALLVTEEGKTITVVTGPAKFVIPTDRLAPFEQVYLGDQAVLSKSATVVLVARNGESKVVPRTGEYKGEYRTELVKIDEKPFTQTAVVQSAEVEERGPGRACVALKGTFSTAEAKSLDFTARLYFYAHSPLAQMTLSVRNRQLDSMARFVGLDRLAVELPLKSGGQVTVDADGQPATAAPADKPLRLAQTAWDKFSLTTPDGKTTDGRQSAGWGRVAGATGTVTAGTRWFWQVHPVGLSVSPDGTVALDLKSADGERVDLYTAGAKTHFLFFDFAQGQVAAPASVAAGATHPLVAVCDPNWYCQETRVFGDLYANKPALFKPEYRDVIARYQKRIDECMTRIVANRPRPGWKVNEYGWLNFGSGLHDPRYVRENAHESWWDGNYYDFPHAAIVNFLRTGDLVNLTTAEEAGLHLADIDICHSFPGDPAQAGSPRSGPVVGHFRNYTRGQNFEGHNSFTFYKNESLYELYYLTGERWFHEVGLMSSDFAMVRWGQGATRNVAHGIWGVLSAYQDTHQKKYLDRAQFFVDKWAKPWQDKYQGSFNDQIWMTGLQFEAYDKYFRLTGDQDTARYNLMAVDSAIREEDGDGEWKKSGARSGLCLAGYAYAYDYTGDEKYLKYGLEVLERTTKASAERVKTFAQQFRASPYFLKVLTAGYEPKPVLGPPAAAK